MPRKIAMFFDGTWNTPKNKTNVELLYELTRSDAEFKVSLGKRWQQANAGVLSNADQIKYYHSGVGTNKYTAIPGGLFGLGISRNIMDGYLWLAEHYSKGDQIFLFGFSRGAYTARSLVGLIRKCGILRKADDALVDEAYSIYRNKEWDPDGREADAFRKTFSWPNGSIHCIGVWDTVGALGIPAHRVWFGKEFFTWHDTELSRMVQNAFHALAMDEHRTNFAATVWSNAKKPSKGQTVEQRWFAGAHADVGGGNKGTRLQQISLAWIQEAAKTCGLKFTSDIRPPEAIYLDRITDSYGKFLWGLYKLLPWNFPYYRPLHFGVHEKIDDSLWKRVRSPQGKNEKGEKYLPYELINIK